MNYVQVVLECKEDEVDVGTCSESCQDSDVDVSEFLEDHFLSFCCGKEGYTLDAVLLACLLQWVRPFFFFFT